MAKKKKRTTCLSVFHIKAMIKHSNIHDHPFRNGIRMKTGSQEFRNSL